MTAPCGVPSTVSIFRPSSSTPAANHLRISLTIRRSPIRCSINRISHAWLIVSKNDRISASRTQLIRRFPQPIRERVQRIVLSTLRPEPVTEPQELRLVDRRQDRRHRRLDNLVLQRGNAQRSTPPIRLRNIPSTGGQRSIPSPMHTRVKALE